MPRLASGSNRPPGHTAYQAPAGSNRHLAAPVPRLSAGSNQARAYQPRVAPPAVVNTRPAAPMSHGLSAAGALGRLPMAAFPARPRQHHGGWSPTNSQAALTSSSSGSNKKTKNCNKCQDPGDNNAMAEMINSTEINSPIYILYICSNAVLGL
ncbi:hypothetical protein ZWY2020_039825 [Hordeum vulgare]|nr:hypothetical protein ZWY2020_039825 [Hordeum vulgare]